MRSKDILKQALIKYDGSMVIVSHDREFLDGLVGKVYEFKGRKIRQHIGGIYNFLARKKMESLKELELNDKRKQQDKQEGISENKLNYEEKKEYERNLRKAKNKVNHVEKEIATIEAELGSLQELMKDPEKSSEADIYKRFSSLNQSLERKLYEWELLNDEVEALQKDK